MFCSACGNDNVSGSQTCSKCGGELAASATIPPTAVTSTAQTKAAPLIASAALAGMGGRAIATILDWAVAAVSPAAVEPPAVGGHLDTRCNGPASVQWFQRFAVGRGSCR